MDKMYEQFRNPDVKYRPAPFWIWNEEMDAKETTRQLDEMKKHGFGGGFAHVRQGLISPYLGEEFFECFRQTLEFCKKNDILLYMYDENGWPSGSAGGHTRETLMKNNPGHNGELASWIRRKVLNAKETRERLDVLSRQEHGLKFAALYVYYKDENRVVKLSEDITLEELEKLGDTFFVLDRKPEHSGFPDMGRLENTKAFIESTYDEYYKRFGEDFGGAIPAVFSDEASLEGFNTDDMFLYSETVSETFYKMHGYRIEDNFAAVYDDYVGDFDRDPAKIRYDISCTFHELWIEHFIKPIANWCGEHGIAWTGHDQEHSWPLTRGGAFSEQRTYEFRQWPGIDWLLCDALREDASWNDTHLMHEVRSAANQFNKERTLCEAYGAAGWHATFKDFKRIADWLLVNGINFFAQHLTHYSIIGSRKRDCPQSIDWRQPWWDEYTEYNDYLARASYLLSTGKMEQRILLMNPSTTAYMIPATKQIGHINHTKTPDEIKNPSMKDHLTLAQKLIDQQWDYDLGDEFSLADNYKVVGNKLMLGAMTYDVVLISDDMKNIRKKTLDILTEFAKNGGKIITTGKACEFVDGERNDEALAEFRKYWIIAEDADGVDNQLAKLLPRRITSSNGWVTGINHIRRVYEDGKEAYFFVNHSMKPFATKVTVKGKSAAMWDLYTGDKWGVKCEEKDGYITFDLDLEWMQSAMIIVNDTAPAKAKKPEACVLRDMKLIDVVPEKGNNILLDHCTLTVKGRTTPEIYYVEAARKLYRAVGEECPVFRDRMQIHSEYIDKVFDESSAFEACYKLKIQEGALPAKAAAVFERPDLMNLRVNGTNVEWKGEGHYLDYKMGQVDITPYLKEGDNELVIWADVFNIRDEIESLIIEGDFGVTVENERFVICKKPETLGYGSWIDQKYRFYPNAMCYNYEVELDEKPESAKIVMKKYEASAVSVYVNGKYVAVVGRDGDDYAEIAEHLTAGKNTVTLRVCASFRNIYGPYLNYMDQTVATWSDFEVYREGEVALASEYSMIDYGLYEAPELYINK